MHTSIVRSSPLLWAAFTALVLHATPTLRAAESGFVPLFDGRTLDGWEGHPAIWSVRDGAITGVTQAEPRLTHNTFLVWKGGTLEDFELRLSYRIVNGNSGIQYRSKVVEQGAQGPIVAGYQADFEAGKTYSGILYEERGRGILAQRGQLTRIITGDNGRHRVDVLGSLGATDDIQAGIKSEDWNDYIVIARGNHLTHIINGRVTVDVTDDDAARAAKSGVLALQVHVGPPMTVQFKNIRLKRFQAEAGTQAAVSDAQQLQGQWLAISGMNDGDVLPKDFLDTLRLNFSGNKYEVEWADGSDSGSVTLMESTSPRQIEIRSESGQQLKGIYEVNGNTLRVAHGIDGAPRPQNFEGRAGSSVFSVTYRRK